MAVGITGDIQIRHRIKLGLIGQKNRFGKCHVGPHLGPDGFGGVVPAAVIFTQAKTLLELTTRVREAIRLCLEVSKTNPSYSKFHKTTLRKNLIFGKL